MSTTKTTTNVIDMSDNTGGLTWVKGTTAQRTTTTLGDLRANTETNRVEIYTNQSGTSEWRNLKEEAVSNNFNSFYLVVAGGGGGGNDFGGGGGAGGYKTNFNGTALSLSPSVAYNIAIGNGGGSSAGSAGDDGGNSSITHSSITDIISTGGGGGGNGNIGQAGKPGGSGGGGSYTGLSGGTASPAGEGNIFRRQ